MEHNRDLSLVIGIHIFRSETARHLEVNLNRTALPAAAEAVAEVIFNLRAVESAFTRQHLVLHAGTVESDHQILLSLVPGRVVTDTHFRTRRDEVLNVVKSEVLIDLLHDRREIHAFVENLIFRAEDVAVVLRKAADAHQAVQRAGRLVAVALTEFTVADRQIAVRAERALEDLDVTRAVHRLQSVDAVLRLRRKHVGAVLRPVAGLLPEGAVEELRCLHFLVAVVAVDAAHFLLDHLPEGPALRVPENHARGFFLNVEEVHVLAKLAVVAAGGLLQHMQISLQLILRRERGAVDTLQHLVLRVTAPVRAGYLHQLMNLQHARARHVRPAAQIREIALRVKRDLLVFRNRLHELDLVVLAELIEEGDCLVARHFAVRDREVLRHDLVHALFNLREIFFRERLLAGEVIVETVFDRRSDRHFGFRIELLHSLSHQVSGGVANDVKTFLILTADDRDRGVVIHSLGEIHKLSVHAAGKRRTGESGTDRSGNLRHCHGAFKLAL